MVSGTRSTSETDPTAAGSISPVVPLLNSLFGFSSKTGQKSGLFELGTGQGFPGLGSTAGGYSGGRTVFVPAGQPVPTGATPIRTTYGRDRSPEGVGTANGQFVRLPAAPTTPAPFSPERFGVLGDLLDLQNPGAMGAAGLLPLIGLGAAEGTNLMADTTGTFREGLETGFRTDLSPIIAEETRRLYREILPQIGQNFVAMNEGGPFSSDLTGQITGAAGDLASRLGALQFQADEAAAGRRAGLLPLGPGLARGLSDVPMRGAEDLLSLGQQLILEGTPAGRAATVLQLLSGQVPTGAVIRGNRGEAKSGGGGVSLTAAGSSAGAGGGS